MSIVKIGSFGYEIFVVVYYAKYIQYQIAQAVRVNNMLFVVQYLAKKRIICIVEQISNIMQYRLLQATVYLIYQTIRFYPVHRIIAQKCCEIELRNNKISWVSDLQ